MKNKWIFNLELKNNRYKLMKMNRCSKHRRNNKEKYKIEIY